MTNKYKNYTAFFAAIFNIVASSLYYDATGKRFSDPDTVSAALATWFFGASLLLWVIYMILHFTSKQNKSKLK